MKDPGWYLKRLSRMSAGEVLFRVKRSITARAQKSGFLLCKTPPPPDVSCHSPVWIHPSNRVAPREHEVDAIASGRISLFALEGAEVGFPPHWNRDPLTGIEPMRPLFGKTINYRDPNLVGDIKYLWELNRHLHLVAIAQAYATGGNPKHLECVKDLIRSWLLQCPYPVGPNWSSSLELGIRLINWSIVWQLIGGVDSPVFSGEEGIAFRNQWLESIYLHCHFIRHNFSRFSSANNHLIGEAAGLFVASATWSFWEDMRVWQELAYEELVRETLLQNGPDGVNREQAVSYQQFVLDFLVIAALAGRAVGTRFPDVYWERIEAMLEYLASIMDAGGNVPMIGDADDGFVVRLSGEPGFCPYKSLLATGAVLFQRADFAFKAGRLDDKTRWLLGDQAESAFAVLSRDAGVLPVRRSFPDGGCYVLGSDFETPREIRLVVDAGPLGYLSIAAHGHADALAFTLSAAGREFLVDPGTYAYHTNKEWRDYFRGTSAHNTVRVDGENQSVIGGNFMYLRKARAWCEAWEPGDERDRFLGAHDGYARFNNPVIHRREIVLDKKEKRARIVDVLECTGAHVVEQYWHFSEHCKVELNSSMVVAENDGVRIKLIHTGADAEARLVSGSASPPIGWVSRRFDVKVPSPTVVFKTDISGGARLITEICCELPAGDQGKDLV